jgi:hypothetical protein
MSPEAQRQDYPFCLKVGETYYTNYVIMFIPLIAVIIYDLWVYKKVFKVTLISTIFVYASLLHSYVFWESNLIINEVSRTEIVATNLGLVGSASPIGWEQSIELEDMTMKSVLNIS